MKPPWIRCYCETPWCLLHDIHVSDCPCPPAEQWANAPYTAAPCVVCKRPASHAHDTQPLCSQECEERWLSGN